MAVDLLKVDSMVIHSLQGFVVDDGGLTPQRCHVAGNGIVYFLSSVGVELEMRKVVDQAVQIDCLS